MYIYIYIYIYPGSNILCTATYILSLKSPGKHKQDVRGTAGEARTNSGVTMSYETPSHRRASVGRTTRTYLPQLSTDTGCSLEDQSGVMDNRDE